MKKRAELSLNELTKIKSILKGSLIAFGIVGLLAALLLFFLKTNPVLFIPVMVLPVIGLPILISLKSISDEINSRKSNSTVNP